MNLVLRIRKVIDRQIGLFVLKDRRKGLNINICFFEVAIHYVTGGSGARLEVTSFYRYESL